MPDDPAIGFLPPNNGTDGQGFVTFRINAALHVPTNARIDANASIIFDQNEPIVTPPIFNTVMLIIVYTLISRRQYDDNILDIIRAYRLLKEEGAFNC